MQVAACAAACILFHICAICSSCNLFVIKNPSTGASNTLSLWAGVLNRYITIIFVVEHRVILDFGFPNITIIPDRVDTFEPFLDTSF